MPFMSQRKYRKGEYLDEEGDAANEMLLTVTGKFRVVEINVDVPPGRLMGELGFLTPDNRRTATIECIEDGHVLAITYEKLARDLFPEPAVRLLFPCPDQPAPAGKSRAGRSHHRAKQDRGAGELKAVRLDRSSA